MKLLYYFFAITLSTTIFCSQNPYNSEVSDEKLKRLYEKKGGLTSSPQFQRVRAQVFVIGNSPDASEGKVVFSNKTSTKQEKR